MASNRYLAYFYQIGKLIMLKGYLLEVNNSSKTEIRVSTFSGPGYLVSTT